MDFLKDLEAATARHKADKAKRTVAVQVFDDKNTSMVVWMTPADAKRHRALTNRKGQRSILRNVMHNGGRLC